MFEFLRNMLCVMEVAAAATTFLYIKKWKDTYWKWFPIYLTFITAAEIIGVSFARKKMVDINFHFYSYFVIPIEFLFFFWVFNHAFKTTKYSRLPKICTAVYFIALISDAFYFKNYRVFYYSFSYTVGNILLLIMILNFFIQLVNSDKVLKFRQNILFWVSAGLLIYYLGSCPYYGLRNLLVYKYRDLNMYYSVFVYILNCLMYLTFALSFICGKPNS